MEESMSSADDSMEDEEVSEVYGSDKKTVKNTVALERQNKKMLENQRQRTLLLS